MGDDGEPADLPSVYRNLEVLEGLGIVRHLHAGHGPGLYALAGEDAREYLVCESCGEVRSVPAADLDRLREEIRHQFGFEVRFSHFPITGLCARCADQTESAGP
jgi:Fur family ferric uptake transcriptional regulator